MDLAHAVGESAISEGIRKNYVWKFQEAPVGVRCDVSKFNRYGNVGNPPQGASKALGEQLTEAYVDFNVKLLEEIKKISLPV